MLLLFFGSASPSSEEATTLPLLLADLLWIVRKTLVLSDADPLVRVAAAGGITTGSGGYQSNSFI